MALFFYEKPCQLVDQHFGLGMDPEDFLIALAGTPSVSKHYLRPWRSAKPSTARQDTGSKITVNKDSFQVSLDVQQFTPDEISVKAVGSEVIIEGKHEEKEDEHGSISRHFIRRYVLPEGYSVDDVVSSLSADGQLSITAPRRKPAAEEERVVPIVLTEKSRKAVKGDQGGDS